MYNSCDPQTEAYQAPLSMGLPSKHTGVGCHFLPSPGDLPNLWIELTSPTCIFCIAGGFFYHLAPWGVHISSVQFSRSVMSDSLGPHELQHARPPCPSPTPKFTQTHVHQVSDAIQPSHPVVPFSSCPQSLPASESFPKSQLFA